jgi:hydroxyacyl-ACP dehydratase HTD2-like protein with hotdog domain
MEETSIQAMNTPVPSDLEGRSIQEQDSVDLHRWSCYHLFFGLDPGRDRPLGLHWLLFNELASELREDGHPVEMPPFPPLPYPRRMWTGGEVAWSRPPRPGLALIRTSVVSRAQVKTGRNRLVSSDIAPKGDSGSGHRRYAD